MVATATEQVLSITDLEKLNIIKYFKTINQAEFDQTAALFIESGKLLAPFEKPLVGREAIASYLAQEAREMKLFPETGTIAAINDSEQQINLTGKVKTALFTVNIGWYFTVNSVGQIITAKIKLLASPQELLGLKKLKD
ncbi:MAG: nuclear transport factor 2 family protein [Cyanobacteria bacterium P01_A01_bin.40]